MGRDHFHTFTAKLFIELIAVVRFIADQVLGLRLDHVEVKAQLHQSDFVMIGCINTDRERQPWRSQSP